MCARNGLLFHELLSAFGHLDDLNAYIRYGNQMYPVADAHIRFERSTEVKARSVAVVDQVRNTTYYAAHHKTASVYS